MIEQNQCGCPEATTAGGIKRSCSALWSLICGIVGIIICLPALPAVILGIIGLINIKKSAGALKGSGMAITGIILGGLAIIIWPFIGIVASIAIPLRIETKDIIMKHRAEAEIHKFSVVLESYNAIHSGYPTNEQGLEVLKEKKPVNFQIDEIPNDPWGRPYHYCYPGNYNRNSFDLWSDGKDGISETADDLTNWHK